MGAICPILRTIWPLLYDSSDRRALRGRPDQAADCTILLTIEAYLSILSDMGRSFRRPFPAVEKQIQDLGQRLRMARLRRAISTVLFAERMGVSRDTLNRLEKGDPAIALGTYARALRVLGLDEDLDAIARDDELGRKLQDLRLPPPRPRKPRAPATPPAGRDGDGQS